MKEVIRFTHVHHHLTSTTVKKLGRYLSRIENPSLKTLNRLALLAGFQDWKSLKDTVHGDTDASVNYED
ncbi:MAG: hypothetical protein LKE41_05315 [Prevotella sp.]|jgi:hypothetical protein|nr:hypothetical protein [Prevotella sp.]MCI2079760.1 hypothetical protein [Prevotella sp.]MCI2101502.1 hypothetical protein [Prevotella sp.]